MPRFVCRVIRYGAAALSVAMLLLSFGCSGGTYLRLDDVSSMDVKVWSVETQSFATWQASEAELRALVEAYNEGRPDWQARDTTPRVNLTLHHSNGESIVVNLSSQGFHYVLAGGKQRRITGAALDAQFDVLVAKGEKQAAEDRSGDSYGRPPTDRSPCLTSVST